MADIGGNDAEDSASRMDKEICNCQENTSVFKTSIVVWLLFWESWGIYSLYYWKVSSMFVSMLTVIYFWDSKYFLFIWIIVMSPFQVYYCTQQLFLASTVLW